MPKLFEKLLDKKNRKNYIILLFAVGVLLMTFTFSTGKKPENVEYIPKKITGESGDYAESLERRLSEILSRVSGAGRVYVMVNTVKGGELLLAKDENKESLKTTECDSEGGERKTESEKITEETLYVKTSGEPFVVAEASPVVSGVLVLAEGAGDAVVRDALTRAVCTVLGLDIHKVSVCKGGNLPPEKAN